MQDFKRLQQLYEDLELYIYPTSKSYITSSRSYSHKAMNKVQELACEGIRQAKLDIESAISSLEWSLKEIKKLDDVIHDHQCYSDEKGNCIACGRKLAEG